MSNLDKPGCSSSKLEVDTAVTPVRLAIEADLKEIVILESTSFRNTVFAGTELLFSDQTIKRYFNHCPSAFRVVYQGPHLVGFSIIYPLNQQGVHDIEQDEPGSILSMKLSSLCVRFDQQIKAIYLEDVATVPEAPDVVRLALLRDMVETTAPYKVPLYATPITSDGMNLVNRHGFVPLKEAGFGHTYVAEQGFSRRDLPKK